MVFVAVILSVYEIYNGEINIEQNISDVVKDAYALGENNIGGGALGTVAATLILCKLILLTKYLILLL